MDTFVEEGNGRPAIIVYNRGRRFS